MCNLNRCLRKNRSTKKKNCLLRDLNGEFPVRGKGCRETWRKFAFVSLCLIHIKYLKVLYFISCFRVKNEATVHGCQKADESRITAALCPVMWRAVNELLWRLLEFDSSDSLIHTKAKLPSATCTGRASHLDTFKMPECHYKSSNRQLLQINMQ